MNLVLNPEHIRRFNKGDHEIYGKIYNHYLLMITHQTKKLVGDNEAARDITAEVMTRLWSKRATLKSVEQIDVFLKTTARNLSIDHLRHQKVVDKNETGLALLVKNLQNPDAISRILDIGTYMVEEIMRKINDLPEDERTVIKKIYFERMPQIKIAQELNLTENTITNLKKRALQKLKLFLKFKDLLLLLMMWLIIF